MKRERYMPEDPNSFYKIPEHPATLDFTGCKTLGDIHEVLRVQLGLPDYYGQNWDALWDCIFYFRNYPLTVEIYGLYNLPKDLSAEMPAMLKIIDRANRTSPVEFEIKS